MATGTSLTHFDTSLDCAICYSQDGWTPLTFSHASLEYAGEHKKSFSGITCHQGNSEVGSWGFSELSPDCAGCHAGDYKEGPHKKVKEPATKYTVSELTDCTGSCHTYTNPSLSVIEKLHDSKHKVSDGGF